MRIDSQQRWHASVTILTDPQSCPEGWAHVPCPICGDDQQTLFLRAGSYYFGSSGSVTLMQCSCGLVLTNPQPQGQALAAFYNTPQYYTHVQTSGLRPRLQQVWQCLQMRGPLMHLRLGMENLTNISRFAKRNAPRHFPLRRGQRLLDFGCGDGQWARLATTLGLEAIGVEPDDAARKVAIDTGVQVLKTLEQADLATAGVLYDRIVLRHVLEHLPHPRQLLQQLAQRLAPGGRILIAVPNVLSKQAQLFGPWWLGYELPRHLWHFSPATLDRIARQAGLEPIHMCTVELENFAKLSDDRMAEQTGHRGAYSPGPINQLEADGQGTEIVLVAKRASTPSPLPLSP